MPSRRSLWIVCALAALHGIFFIWYQRPDWARAWSDQDGYRRLAHVLATTGQFTRFPDAPIFVPEVLRTPAYPAFVAVIYFLFSEKQVVVALAQTVVFVGICLLVYATARRVTSERVAWIAALAVALYPPLPYFGALVMTEVFTTLLFTAGVYLAIRSIEDRRPATFAVLGVVLGLTTLSRPAFVLFPAALAGTALLTAGCLRDRRGWIGGWLLVLAMFAATMAPWFAYNYATLGVFTLSPAGGIGRGLWEGSWQATWSGRLQNELTHLADDTPDRSELDRAVTAVAAREGLPSEPMLEYVHQWRDIRRIWTDPVDTAERARARIVADREYRQVGLDNIRRDSPWHLTRRLTRGVFVLWAGEIPVRYSDIDALPVVAIRAMWAVQALVFVAALWGVVVLVRRGRVVPAAVLAVPILYVTAVHFPLLKEARQSLPAQPVVLLLATIGCVSRARASRDEP